MPRNKYPEQTVEKILDAAALLFTQKGYQNTTLQDIIDATKLSKGAVYHHFRSKEEIAQRVGDRLGDQMWEPLRHIRDDPSKTEFSGRNAPPFFIRRYRPTVCKQKNRRFP